MAAENSPGQRTIPPRAAETLILFLFFCSGALGLIYEIIWTRLLRHVMGNTVYSVTTVLCAFMAGLALGSWLGGKIIDRRGNPLKVYGLLEGAIGVYCLFLPVLIKSAEPGYRLLYQNFGQSHYLFNLLRFFFSAALLVLPATFMGATLPVLSKFFIRSSERIGRTMGTLYAVNTFGAVLGSFATGFVFIPWWGVSRTISAAVFINLLVGVSALILSRRASVFAEILPRPEPDPARIGETFSVGLNLPPANRFFPAILLTAYALSGFAALVYEIAWTRVLMLIVGSSVYAFCLMLTAFILGLALGGMIFSRFLHRVKDLVLLFAILELAIGFSALLAVPVFGRLPLFITGLVLRFAGSFWSLQLIEFELIFLLMLVPTIMMGGAFPLAGSLYVRGMEKIGGSVGKVYAANTLGSILGSFAGGFLLLPLLGIRNTILAAILINLALGVLFLDLSFSLPSARKRSFAAVVIITALLLIGLLPAWDRTTMTSGAYLYAYQLSRQARDHGMTVEEELQKRRILYHREGVSDTVTVIEDSFGRRAFFVNGKVDGSNATDMHTQELLSHVPLLLHPGPRSVLVIGLATGVTLGSAGRYPVERLDCVEISPSAREPYRFFLDVNYDVLSDPRARLIIADGRNYLSLSGETYDVITSEPSNPWIAGVADLFTREFFELCRKRLNPGGIVCAWIHAYSLDAPDFRSIVHTFHGVFPHTIIWESLPGRDYLLIGSEQAFKVEYGTLRRRMADEKVAFDLGRIGIDDPPQFLGGFMFGDGAVDRYTRGARIHTDDNCRLEFSAPRSLLQAGVAIPLLEEINRYREQEPDFLVWEKVDEGEAKTLRKQIAEAIQARAYAVSGEIYLEKQRYPEALTAFKEAVVLQSWNADWAKEYVDIFLNQAFTRLKAGAIEEATGMYLDLLTISPRDPRLHSYLALAYGIMGMDEKAVAEGKRAIELDPGNAAARNHLAVIYLGMGKYAEAESECRVALVLKPDSPEPHGNLGTAYYSQGRLKDAEAEFKAALGIEPDYPPALAGMALLLEKTGDLSGAEEYRRRAEESAQPGKTE